MTADPQSIDPANGQTDRSFEPVLAVTLYDRVMALLLTLIFTTSGLTVALGAIWLTNHLPGLHQGPTPILPIDVDMGDDWGGVRDGGPGRSWENIGPPGNEPSSGGGANDSAGEELPQLLSAVLREIGPAVETADTLRLGNDAGSNRLRVGSHGTDPVRPEGDGTGPIRGVPLNRRWEIVFEKGLTVDEYARQLDFLEVELAVIIDGKLYKVSQLSSSQPIVRTVDPASVRREILFVWRDEHRRQVDLSLLRRVPIGGLPDTAVVIHFYPPATARKLVELERAHAAAHGRSSLHDVAKTRFAVRRIASGYDFEITQQSYLASSAQ